MSKDAVYIIPLPSELKQLADENQISEAEKLIRKTVKMMRVAAQYGQYNLEIVWPNNEDADEARYRLQEAGYRFSSGRYINMNVNAWKICWHPITPPPSGLFIVVGGAQCC